MSVANEDTKSATKAQFVRSNGMSVLDYRTAISRENMASILRSPRWSSVPPLLELSVSSSSCFRRSTSECTRAVSCLLRMG